VNISRHCPSDSSSFHTDLKFCSALRGFSPWRSSFDPALGKKRMSAVTRSEVQAFVASISRKLAAPTAETVYAVLRAMMQHAVDEDPPVIAVNPCRKIKLPKVRKRIVEPLPARAIVALLVAITPRYRVAVALGAGLGLREGEAFGLLDAKVDRHRKRARIVSQAQRGELDADLKTDASTRTLPADEWVLREVDNHVARFGLGPNGNIMTNRLGRVVRWNSFGTCWREAVANARTCLKPSAEPKADGKCGKETCAAPAHCLPKGTRFHDLRHFYASTLIAANLNPKVIQARLGHASITETMDTYGHLFPDAEDPGRGVIDTALAENLAELERNWDPDD
jgi:integrase